MNNPDHNNRPKHLKDTVHLPQTDFPMKANLATKEPEMLKQWEIENIYDTIEENTKDKKDTFILHDGPPYANGDIHIGHAVNKILKDIIVRSQLLLGKKIEYRPGWDCHGLPIELAVEKKYGKGKLSNDEFRKKCREYAEEQITKQMQDFKRLGVLADWQRPYKTMAFETEAKTVEALKTIWKNKKLVRGAKPVHWCIDCKSALAEAEVEYNDHSSHSLYVSFPIAAQPTNHATIPQNTALVIWTTTPWTLPANQAVCLNPTAEYQLIQITNLKHQSSITNYLIAKSLAENFIHTITKTHEHCTATILTNMYLGNQLSLTLHHPFIKNKIVPVVQGDFVALDTGTGAVHIAPAHGLDDYYIGIKYNLPNTTSINEQGVFTPDPSNTNAWDNQFYAKANQIILDTLQSQGNLIHHETYQHSYPHCWRHKSPVIFRATPQWFISIDQKAAQDAIKESQWFPNWGQERISKMVAGRTEWCVSRQRIWGTPIPIVVYKETGEPHESFNDTSDNSLQTKIFNLAIKTISEGGIEAWHSNLPELLSLLKNENKNDALTIASDTMDVWFDSGVTHHSVLNDRKHNRPKQDSNQGNHQTPTETILYLEGSDQHRGWFQSSLLTSVAMHGYGAPYDHVLTHGFVVDEKGHKMSKSLGNVIAPQTILKTLGADILRLWVASSDTTNEIKISDTILQQHADAYRKIRNTLRYLHSNLNDFNPKTDTLPFEELLLIDQWVVLQIILLKNKFLELSAAYDFSNAVHEIINFCTVTLSNYYLDLNKDRMYTGAKNGRPRKSAQTAMDIALTTLIELLSPIFPFTTKEIKHFYRYEIGGFNYSIPNENKLDLFLTQIDIQNKFQQSGWIKPGMIMTFTHMLQNVHPGKLSVFDYIFIYFNYLILLKNTYETKMEPHRKEGTIGSSLESEVQIICDQNTYDLLTPLGDELRHLFICSKVALSIDSTKKNISEIELQVTKCPHTKCERCWHYEESCTDYTFADGSHNTICSRCITNLENPDTGEERRYL
ncbi:MAG: isoleucine--tRNA ligase [Methylacidiphilales bacterium]|nr:isoleucine--tRNA ligase [Candidatus Methylacidiphilales bacterium]